MFKEESMNGVKFTTKYTFVYKSKDSRGNSLQYTIPSILVTGPDHGEVLLIPSTMKNVLERMESCTLVGTGTVEHTDADGSEYTKLTSDTPTCEWNK